METENNLAIPQESSVKKKCKWSKDCVCSKNFVDRRARFVPLLEKLSASGPKKRMSMLRNASTCFVRFLSECGLNVLKGNLKLSDDQYERLRPHKKVLLSISDPTSSMKDRRKFLMRKKGGALPALIPIAIYALSTVAGELIGRAIFPNK